MPEETKKFIPATTVKQNYRPYTEACHKAHEHMDKTKKPVCIRCMKQDFDRGRMQPLNHYIKQKYELVAEAKIKHPKDPTHIIGKTRDYRCPRNHGITVQEQWEDDTLPIVKTKKTGK